MDADRAIAIIETLVAPKSLNLIQTQIIRGVIAGESYQQIVMATEPETAIGRYQISYVKETGAQLWQLLSARLGQKVTKKSLAAVLCWYAKQLESSSELEGTSGAATSDLSSQLRSPDWGELVSPLATDRLFYGRERELAQLTDWCIECRCRTISIVGMGGMGKSTLARELARQLADRFELTIWRSLLNTPSVTELCGDLLSFLNPPTSGELPDSIESQIELLLACLQRHRCLLIFDNVESILEGQVQAGRYLPGYENYDLLFKAIGDLPHQSCLMLTSREQPQTITRSQIVHPQLVRSLPIGGLTSDAAYQSIRALGCIDLPEQMWQEIYEHYSGNPLALKIATITAIEMTGGGDKLLELYPLMRTGQLPFRDIDDILQRQFERLSAVEQQLVYWLAIEREPMTSTQLWENLLPTTAIQGGILNALQSLLRRCIVIRQDRAWTLPPVTLAHVTRRAIDTLCAELSPPTGELTADANSDRLQQQFAHLNTHAIIGATAKDYLRQAQMQSILRPLLDRLLTMWGERSVLIRYLHHLLRQWQSLTPPPLGYLAGNILNLLIELEPERRLTDLDCSGLAIWSAYLVDVKLERVNFATAAFERSAFTQAFGGIVSSTFDPAGNLLATGDANGDIYLWRIADGQRMAIYRGHSNWTRSLAFSPDGTLLVSASDDCTIKLWQVATGTEIATIGPHTHSFRGVRFNNDGSCLITGGDDARVRIYDLLGLLDTAFDRVPIDRCIQLSGHTNWVFSSVQSPDGNRLASTSADGTVRIWELATGDCVQMFQHDFWTIRTIFRPDSYELIVSGLSANIYVWDTSSGKLVRTLTGHTDWVWSIECSADGKTLYSTGEDRTIRVWDLTDGSCRMAIRAHHQRIWTLALAPDGQHLVSGSEDRKIKIWDLHYAKCLKTMAGYSNRIESIAFAPKRGWLISGHQDRTIRIWDLRRFTCIHTLVGHTDAVTTIAISPDSNYLASNSLDSTIRIWNLDNLTCQHAIDIQSKSSWSCAMVFSLDSRQLMTGGDDDRLKILDVETGTQISSLRPGNDRSSPSHSERIRAVAICKTRNLLVTAGESQLWIADLQTGECIQTIAAHALPLTCVTFSADGRYLASGSIDKTAKIWDTHTWECLQTLVGHHSWVLEIAFSPTPVTYGDRTAYQLISGGCDRFINRWEIATGECIYTYIGHTNWVWSLAYSLDGLTLASASEDETINIWDLDRTEPVRTLRIERPYEHTNIAGATGLLPGQRQSLQLLGAIDA